MPTKKPAYYDIIKAKKNRKASGKPLKFPDADITFNPNDFLDGLNNNQDISLFEKKQKSDDAFFETNKIPIYNKLGAEGDVNFNPYSLLNSQVSFDFLKKIPLRLTAIVLSLILILPLFFYAVVKANEFFYVKGMLDQAKIFNNSGSYQEALLLLTLTEGKWGPSSMRADIELEKQKALAGINQKNSLIAPESDEEDTTEIKKAKLNKVIDKANDYLGNIAPSLKLDADRLYESCLATWNKLQIQFPGSNYEDYRLGCGENRETYLNNIAADERKYNYHKLRAEFLLNRLETDSFSDVDRGLYSEITKILE